MPAEDIRKEYLLSSCGSFLGLPANDDAITSLYSARELNTFLDDGNCTVLSAKVNSSGGSKKVYFANKVNLLDT